MKTFCVLIGLLFLINIYAATMWENDLAVRKADNLKWDCQAIKTSTNQQIMVWTDTQYGSYDIYAQLINPNGEMVWQEPLRITSSVMENYQPRIVETTDGCFVILWGEYDTAWQYRMRAQKINLMGQLLWGENGVLVNETFASFDYYLVPNAQNSAFIVWVIYDGSTNVYGQNLDSSGNLLWNSDGLLLVQPNAYSVSINVLTDGQGGFVLSYHANVGGEFHQLISRFSSTGTALWANPVVLPANNNDERQYKLISKGNEEYWATSVINIGGENKLTLQVLNNAGQLLLPQQLFFTLSAVPNEGTLYDIQLVTTSDGGLMYAFYTSALSPNTLRVNKITSDYQLAWAAPGIQISDDNLLWNPNGIASDSSGGCYLTWVKTVEDGYDQCVKAQHISNTGTLLWGAQGLLLSNNTAFKDNPTSVATTNGNIVTWLDHGNNALSLRYLTIQSDGTLLNPVGGISVRSLLSGICYICDNISLNDRTMTIWTDSREQTNKLYYQIIYPDGSVALEEKGRALTSGMDGNQYFLNAVQAGNSVAILYSSGFDNDNHVYLQVINDQGNTLYPEYGILIYSEYSYGGFLSYYNGDIYVGWNAWSMNGTNEMYYICGQRISNGLKMWGENGIVISQTSSNITQSLKAMAGRYFIWTRYTSNGDNVFALLVNTNGSPAAGWEPSGMQVAVFVPNEPYHNLSVYNSGLLGENLAVSFIVYSNGGSLVKVQCLSSAGEYVWNNHGISISDTDPTNYQECFNTIFNNGIVLAYYDYCEGNPGALKIQKLDIAGNRMFGNTGSIVQQLTDYAYESKVIQFSNGSYCYLWVIDNWNCQNEDIVYRYIAPDGTMQDTQPYLNLCQQIMGQRNIKPAVIGNEAIISWNDARAGILNEEEYLESIYAQKINNEIVPSSDLTVSSQIAFSLSQNHPNPFNPSTTLSFELFKDCQVTLNIYNIKGQQVASLVKDRLSKGKYHYNWKGLDDNGKKVASGVYLYRLESAGKSVTMKMLLLK